MNAEELPVCPHLQREEREKGLNMLGTTNVAHCFLGCQVLLENVQTRLKGQSGSNRHKQMCSQDKPSRYSEVRGMKQLYKPSAF